ncbi:alpha/beta fold hydrolase [Nocardia asteroides]|uniref:alpha/beta fold hydrolase n=1 Tax=Nocardia asteroides TaxID=1824 RepID=UPI00342B08F8
MQASHRQPGSVRGTGPESFSVPAENGELLMVTRFGAHNAPATVVYLPGPLSDSAYFMPLVLDLQNDLGSAIAHLVYDRRRALPPGRTPAGRAAMAQRVDDLDAVIGGACGHVVLVVHSVSMIVVQEWLFRHRHDRQQLAAIVAVCPVPELADPAGALTANPTEAARRAGIGLVRAMIGTGWPDRHLRGDAVFEAARQDLRAYRRCGTDLAVVEDLLRATPTWILAGRQDTVVHWERAEELASTVWAELVVVEDAGHDLAHTHLRAAVDATVAALKAVHDLNVYGGSW